MADVTPDQLRRHVGGGADLENDDLQALINTAKALLDRYLAEVDADATATPDTPGIAVPDAIRDRATLLVAAELFAQDQAPNGYLNQSYDNDGLPPAPVSTDPLRPARRLLEQWVSPVTFA